SFLLMSLRPRPRSTLFPYTTLFRSTGDDPELLPTMALFGDPRPQAQAQLHGRLAPPLIALAFALLTVPMARSAPRQQRYGRMMLDRKSTRLNSSHVKTSYAVLCLKK